MSDHLGDAKHQAEDLVATARRLVATAEEEAAAIVADGHRRVEAIVADARALREAAETEAQALRAEAEALLEEAKAARASAPPRVVGTAQPVDGGVAEEQAIEQASSVADRILRVARSEAEARTRDIIDAARRKAEQIEHDTRARNDTEIREHRAAVRRLQEQELETKARVREAESRLAMVERRLSRGLDEAQRRGVEAQSTEVSEAVAPSASETIVLSSGIEFPKPRSQPADRVQPGTPETSRPAGEPTRTTHEPPDRPADDQDRLKALRAIRRRA